MTAEFKFDEVLVHTETRCTEANRHGGVFVERGFGEFCQNHGVTLNLQIARENISCAKRTVKHLFPYSPIPLLPSKRVAFTLAETLITLGIIGVVAAMTLPSVIQNYKNHVVETRLAKFYSTFNQAIQMSIAENGDISNWYRDLPSFMTRDENGELTSEGLVWFNTYIGKYMNISKVEQCYNGNPLFYLPDGNAFSTLNEGVSRDWAWYTNYDKCIKKFGRPSSVNNTMVGKCQFRFIFEPNFAISAHKNKGLEPYLYSWGTEPKNNYIPNAKKAGHFAQVLSNITDGKFLKIIREKFCIKNKKLYVISGSSGVGKGTVLKGFLSENPNFTLSVSCKTRAPRKGEVDGVNYFFLSKEEFQSCINNDKFLKWAEFAGNFYGTGKNILTNVFLTTNILFLKQAQKVIYR